MKKSPISYFLIIFSTLGIIFDVIALWGVSQVKDIYTEVNAPFENLTYIYLRFSIIFVVHILSLIIGVILYRKGDKVSSNFNIFSIVILVILFISYWFVIPFLVSSILMPLYGITQIL